MYGAAVMVICFYCIYGALIMVIFVITVYMGNLLGCRQKSYNSIKLVLLLLFFIGSVHFLQTFEAFVNILKHCKALTRPCIPRVIYSHLIASCTPNAHLETDERIVIQNYLYQEIGIACQLGMISWLLYFRHYGCVF